MLSVFVITLPIVPRTAFVDIGCGKCAAAAAAASCECRPEVL